MLISLLPAGSVSAQAVMVWNKATSLWSFQSLVGASGSVAGVTYASYGVLPGTGAQQQVVGVEVTPANVGGYVTIGTRDRWLDGSTIFGTVRRYSLDLGEPDAVKTVTRVDLNIKCTDTAVVTLAISGQMDESQTVAFGPPITATKALHWQVPCFAVGRFISLEVSCTEPGYECHGFGIVTGVQSAY